MTSENLSRFAIEFLGPFPRYAVQQGFTIHTLLQLDSEERLQAEEMLLQALEAGNTDVRVLMGLEELRSEQATAPLEGLLKGGKLRPDELVHAALALWKIKQFPRSLGYIINVLKRSQDYYYKVTAIDALQHFHCQEAVDALKGFLTYKHPAVRSQAMRSILAIYDLLTGIGWPPLVIDMMLDDPDKWQAGIAELDRLVGHLPLPRC